jgi:hypothetical protein
MGEWVWVCVEGMCVWLVTKRRGSHASPTHTLPTHSLSSFVARAHISILILVLLLQYMLSHTCTRVCLCAYTPLRPNNNNNNNNNNPLLLRPV